MSIACIISIAISSIKSVVYCEMKQVHGCVYPVQSVCVVFFQPSQLEGQQLLQVQQQQQPQQQQQQEALQLEASRTTAQPGLSTTDSRLPTMDRQGRRLDRQLLHSRDNR